MPHLYLLHLSLNHPTFRIPELLSCAKLFGFGIRIVSEDVERAFLVVELEEERDAIHLAERCILVRSVSRLFGHAPTYSALQSIIQADLEPWQPYMTSSFSFLVDSVGRKMLRKRITEAIESFAFLDLKGKIDLKDPEVTFMIMEEYHLPTSELVRSTTTKGEEPHDQLREVYISRLIALGKARDLIDKFDVKGRAFFGNTSMESEMSLLMATQALAAPGKVVYDPFAGTGSLLYTSMYWGAMAFGSDIDGRQMRGRDKSGPGVYRTANQFGVREKLIDVVTFDVTINPWRCGGLLDAIVTDPPYGVRAGAKRLGRRETRKKILTEAVVMSDGSLAHECANYVPPCKPYEMAQLVLDLVLFARYMLVPGGRLVFFLPTFPEEFEEYDVPVVEGMEEVKYGDGSCQDFHRWSRRLITMERTSSELFPRPTFEAADPEDLSNPAHLDFSAKHHLLRRQKGAAATAETEVGGA